MILNRHRSPDGLDMRSSTSTGQVAPRPSPYRQTAIQREVCVQSPVVWTYGTAEPAMSRPTSTVGNGRRTIGSPHPPRDPDPHPERGGPAPGLSMIPPWRYCAGTMAT